MSSEPLAYVTERTEISYNSPNQYSRNDEMGLKSRSPCFKAVEQIDIEAEESDSESKPLVVLKMPSQMVRALDLERRLEEISRAAEIENQIASAEPNKQFSPLKTVESSTKKNKNHIKRQINFDSSQKENQEPNTTDIKLPIWKLKLDKKLITPVRENNPSPSSPIQEQKSSEKKPEKREVSGRSRNCSMYSSSVFNRESQATIDLRKQNRKLDLLTEDMCNRKAKLDRYRSRSRRPSVCSTAVSVKRSPLKIPQPKIDQAKHSHIQELKEASRLARATSRSRVALEKQQKAREIRQNLQELKAQTQNQTLIPLNVGPLTKSRPTSTNKVKMLQQLEREEKRWGGIVKNIEQNVDNIKRESLQVKKNRKMRRNANLKNTFKDVQEFVYCEDAGQDTQKSSSSNQDEVEEEKRVFKVEISSQPVCTVNLVPTSPDKLAKSPKTKNPSDN